MGWRNNVQSIVAASLACAGSLTACGSSTGFIEATESHGVADPGGELDEELCVELLDPSWNEDPAGLPSGFRGLRLPGSQNTLDARLTAGPIDGGRWAAVVVTGNALLLDFGHEDDLDMVVYEGVADGGWRPEPSRRTTWSATTGRLYGIDLGMPAQRHWVRTPTRASGLLGTDAYPLKPMGLEMLEPKGADFEVLASLPRPSDLPAGAEEDLLLSWVGNPRLESGERVVAAIWSVQDSGNGPWSSVMVARWNANDEAFTVLSEHPQVGWSGPLSLFGLSVWGASGSSALLYTVDEAEESVWTRLEIGPQGTSASLNVVDFGAAASGELLFARGVGDSLVGVFVDEEKAYTVWNLATDGTPSQRVSEWRASTADAQTQVRLGDVDGDGLADVIHHEYSGEVRLELSSVKATRVFQAGHVGNVFLEDLQGDGRDEVVVQVHGEPDEAGELLVLQFSGCP